MIQLRIFIFILLYFSSFAVNAQDVSNTSFFSRNKEEKDGIFNKPFPKFKVTRNKQGFLIGYQKGKYDAIELGLERQWKQIRLKSPATIAGAVTMEYQFNSNVLGYKIGPWIKFGRMDFTYGTNLFAFSDFEHWRIGISPALGFKLFGFHFISSYNIPFNSNQLIEFNKLHVSIRYFISKKRNLKFKRSN